MNGLLHAHATRESLVLLRRLVFGIILFQGLTGRIETLSAFPMSSFKAVGVLMRSLPESWYPLLASSAGLWVIKSVLIVSTLIALTKRFPVPSAAISCLAFTLHESVVRSFGHANHPDIALMFAAYFLTLFAVCDSMVLKKSPDLQEQFNIWSVSFIAILSYLLCTTMFIGMYRLLANGPDLFLSDSMRYWVAYNAKRMSNVVVWNSDVWAFNHPWILDGIKFGYPIVTVFEILSLLVLLSKRFRYVYIVVMFGFYALNTVFLNIFFWQNMILSVLLFDWTRRTDFHPRRAPTLS